MRTRSKAIVFLLLMLYIMACCFFSCSPGKKLLDNQAALAELNKRQQAHDKTVAAAAVNEFVKNNPCSPIPEINLDSLCSIYYQCPEGSNNAPAEEYTAGGNNYSPALIRPKPKTVLIPFEDNRRIELLTDSIREKDKRLAVASAQLQTIAAAGEAAAVEKIKKIKLIMWLFLGVAIAELIAIIIIAKR